MNLDCHMFQLSVPQSGMACLCAKLILTVKQTKLELALNLDESVPRTHTNPNRPSPFQHLENGRHFADDFSKETEFRLICASKSPSRHQAYTRNNAVHIARPPHQPPVILSGTPELGLTPLTCVCWQINSILANIGHRNSIRILNQYPFWWNILIWA